MFPKGAFIYRLAGRDREKSASYYTPESLTRTLVKYTLKELLPDRTADEILGITVCEPAMARRRSSTRRSTSWRRPISSASRRSGASASRTTPTRRSCSG